MIGVAGPAAYAVEPGLGAVARHQALLDAGTDLRLMCVAAHPDDEDGATLAMYRKKFGYKTFAVLATRGEGGQNEIGPELYQELAVLRTDEMSRASAITGAELHFLDLPEFGYSKSREETFEIWGHDNALERMVRLIRELRPDVIITHHGPTGGHGHHQAIGLVLQEAFDIAGDPNRFPQHMKEGLEPWQPARLYLRNFGGEAGARIGFNELDSVRGVTYAQIAAQALDRLVRTGERIQRRRAGRRRRARARRRSFRRAPRPGQPRSAIAVGRAV
jgi:LmbE family N-acetylglucosaminyl deacetylase